MTILPRVTRFINGLIPELAIQPNQGFKFKLGELPFGASASQVRGYLGKPDDVDTNELIDGLRIAWYYRKLRMDLLFCTFLGTGEMALETGKPGSVLRLILCTSSSRRLKLWGNKIIGKPAPEVMALLKSHGCDGLEKAWNSSVRVEELSLDLHFERNLLQLVQWGTLPREWPFCHRFP